MVNVKRLWIDFVTAPFSHSDDSGITPSFSRKRTNAENLPWDTNDQYGGWGGHKYHRTNPGISKTPVLFVHGNTRNAYDWKGHAKYFLNRGYKGDEVWAITFSEETTPHDDMAAQLDDFVSHILSVTNATSINIVGHSLGVTGVRYWMEEYSQYGKVNVFVGLAGANHGTTVCTFSEFTDDGDGVHHFLNPQKYDDSGHPLRELNTPDETPGDVDYYTIKGIYDMLFAGRIHSPRLDGAEKNVTLAKDHDGVKDSYTTKKLIFQWLNKD